MNKFHKVIIACFVCLLMTIAPAMAQEAAAEEQQSACASTCGAMPAVEFQQNKACFVPSAHAFVVIDSVDNTIDIRKPGENGLERISYQVDNIEKRYDVKAIIRPVDVRIYEDMILFVATNAKDSSYLGILDMDGNLVATYGMRCHSDALGFFTTPCGHGKAIMVMGFNPQGYDIHTFVYGGDFTKLQLADGLTTEYHRMRQSEVIQQSDPVGVGLTVIAVLVVFLALVLVACIIALLSKVIRNSEERKTAKAAAPQAQAATAAPAASASKDGEVYAAIAAAIHMYMDELHDEESNIITIEEKGTAWNSKIYNMNQTNPKRN